jgi:hypothetical protein
MALHNSPTDLCFSKQTRFYCATVCLSGSPGVLLWHFLYLEGRHMKISSIPFWTQPVHSSVLCHNTFPVFAVYENPFTSSRQPPVLENQHMNQSFRKHGLTGHSPFTQENYLNYTGGINNDQKRLDVVARAANAIADGDMVNVRVRRYQQWGHMPFSAFNSTVLPATYLHGRRETLAQVSWVSQTFPTPDFLALDSILNFLNLAPRTLYSSRGTFQVDLWSN